MELWQQQKKIPHKDFYLLFALTVRIGLPISEMFSCIFAFKIYLRKNDKLGNQILLCNVYKVSIDIWKIEESKKKNTLIT